jgi:hypothetical protein
VTDVASQCGPVMRPRIRGDLEARPVSSSRGLHILGSMRALVSPSDSILVLVLLCF